MKSLIHGHIILLNVLLTLLVQVASSLPTNTTATTEKEEETTDKFYIIHVNETYDNTLSSHKNAKRADENAVVDLLIENIHQLIVENVDTYDNPEVLEELEEEGNQLRKRDLGVEYLMDYGDSNYVYPIATLENQTILYAYLSADLVDTVCSMKKVSHCFPSVEYEKAAASYVTNDIIKEANWANLSVRTNAHLHLSLLSQGKYDETLVKQYDTNYYYPKTAGKGTNLVFIDSGFNFNHSQFKNTNQRQVKCLCIVKNAKVMSVSDANYCFGSDLNDHGTIVATAAAGTIDGVASQANVYGISLDRPSNANIIAALEYTKQYYLIPNKTVVNLSMGGIFSITNKTKTEITDILAEDALLKELSQKGVIIVNSAGNNGKIAYNEATNEAAYPCYSDYTICVGGIQNINEQDQFGNVMPSSSAYKLAKNSNYGRGVDLYAPYYIVVNFFSYDKKEYQRLSSGTSNSAPLVSGLIATIIAEHPGTKFNQQSILDYLRKTGLEGVVSGLPSGAQNYFVNNGKKTVYSGNNQYNGCGVSAGNRKCSSNQCCAASGKCYASSKAVCKTTNGCQTKFGTCNVVYTSTNDGRCGLGVGSCRSGYCCSYYGYCGKTSDYCGLGCQPNLGICN